MPEREVLWNESGELADNAADAWEYPNSDSEGILPEVTGTFSGKTIDGLRIYIPKREIVG